eukprot:TRINITY_DN1688_c0_g1_i1.p1 TRINITY_DN1688_c0_g1~~TRINITY_DN1688_c0_g1_i1.p1  ORF type:complete len:345 (-),score=60.03 TRINITY_DN1688_c0_g1_i1:172-1206(-)
MELAWDIWFNCCQADTFWRNVRLEKVLYELLHDTDSPRIVVAARHTQTPQRYAIKMIKTEAESLYEVQILSCLNHEHIIRYEKVTHLRGWWVICMKQAEKGDCVQLLEKEGKLTESRARTIFIQLLYAVKYLHNNGFAHRDIKLDNMLLTKKDQLILTDFEYSAKMKPFIPFTDRVGTLRYSSPEVRMGRFLGPEADMWAVGVSLFCLVNGKFPFSIPCLKSGGEAYEPMENRFDPGLSEPCRDLLKKLLHTNPRYRLSVHEALEHPWCMTVDESEIGTIPNILAARQPLHNSSPVQRTPAGTVASAIYRSIQNMATGDSQQLMSKAPMLGAAVSNRKGSQIGA